MLIQPIKPAAATAFQDVLVPVLNVDADEPALRAADEICSGAGGRVTAFFAPPLPSAFYAGDSYGGVEMWASVIAELRKDSAKQAAKLRARLAKAASATQFRTVELEFFMARQSALMGARHADITILLAPDDDENRTYRQDLVETVLFQSGRPVMIIPPKQSKPMAFDRILVAWNASRESARAVGDAAGIIDGAQSVQVVTVDAKPSTYGSGEAPGVDIAAHLSHRGAKVEVNNLDSMGRTDAACILDAARQMDADLIVLGAYGHARMQQFVFGGVTRDLLHGADRPLFMSH
jgi:nucleotide-binding universal stress UspA family protein